MGGVSRRGILEGEEGGRLSPGVGVAYCKGRHRHFVVVGEALDTL